MIKIRLFYLFFVLFFPTSSYACFCGYDGIEKTYQRAEFVARARITKITPDPENPQYHDAVIEIITLYKGTKLTRIKIASELNTSCAFLPRENTTWIIFAQRWQGILSFGSCSGSMNTGDAFDAVENPGGSKNYSRTIKLREECLAFLSKHKLLNPNPTELRAIGNEALLFDGFKNKNSFAVYQVDVNPDLSMAGIKQLKKFQNKKLNNLVYQDMKTKVKLYGKHLTKSTRIIIFLFYYQHSDSEEGYVSLFDS